MTGTSALTAADQATITEARTITALHHEDIRAYTGDDDLTMAYAVAFGRAQWHLGDLLRIIDRLDAAVTLEAARHARDTDHG